MENVEKTYCAVVSYIFDGKYKIVDDGYPTWQILRTMRNFNHHLFDKTFPGDVRKEVLDGHTHTAWEKNLLQFFENHFKGFFSHVYHKMGKYRADLEESGEFFTTGAACGLFDCDGNEDPYSLISFD